jgi:hypothetical protein
MVIGEITSSQQDIMFVQVRVEDAAFLETHNGQQREHHKQLIDRNFNSPLDGRIKIKIGNVNESSKLRLSLWDSPTKTKLFFENDISEPWQCILHLLSIPPRRLPGTERLSGSVGVADWTVRCTMHTDGIPRLPLILKRIMPMRKRAPCGRVGDR